MADRKISDLTALTTPASGDYLPIVDISEAAAASKNKRITIEELFRGVPLGTAAAPSIAIEGDEDTGVFSPGANQLAISTNGTGRLFVDASGQVGVGTSSPSSALHVAAADNSQVFIAATDANPTTIIIDTDAGSSERIRINNKDGALTVDTTNTLEAMRIDTSRRLLVGTSSARANFTSGTRTSSFQVEGTTLNNSALSILRNSNDTGQSGIYLAKSRSTTVGDATPDIVADGDSLGSIFFQGADNTNFVSSASITAAVDGTPGADDMPGRLVLATTADGASSPTERLRITNAGQIAVAGAGTAAAPVITKNDDLNTGIFFPAADTIAFAEGGSETMRIDSSSRLLIGTSTNIRGTRLEVLSTDNNHLALVGGNQIAQLEFARSSDAAGGAGLVAEGNVITRIQAVGNDGSAYRSAARIEVVVDGTPSASDMPGRIVLLTTLNGEITPIEAFRITNDRVVAYNQAAPAAVNTTATITAANLKTGIITSTTAAAVTMTLPTGTDIEAGFSGIYTNMTFEFSVINTGPNALTVGANGNTTVGSLTVATLTSARYALRRTGANAFTLYRLS